MHHQTPVSYFKLLLRSHFHFSLSSSKREGKERNTVQEKSVFTPNPSIFTHKHRGNTEPSQSFSTASPTLLQMLSSTASLCLENVFFRLLEVEIHLLGTRQTRGPDRQGDTVSAGSAQDWLVAKSLCFTAVIYSFDSRQTAELNLKKAVPSKPRDRRKQRG